MARKASWFALALLFATGAQATEPSNYTSRDIRHPIQVTVEERNQTLFEMRDLLHGLFNLHLALSKNDFLGAAVAARPIGNMFERIPASLRERLPVEYLQLSIAMRESFDILAREAETKKDMSAVQSQLAETMTYCSGCHDTYRFEIRSRIPGRK